MSRSVVGGVFVVGMVLAAAMASAEEVGTEIELRSLNDVVSPASSEWADVPLEDVARRMGDGSRRFYGSLMISPTFAGMNAGFGSGFSSTDTVMGAGGAVGMAFDRRNGQMRLEVEGMGRGTYDGSIAGTGGLRHVTTNNWSAMVNGWRDFMLTDRVGLYGGGGIGAGGYIWGTEFLGNTAYIAPASGFAWQAGGGVIWEVSDRVTFDVGYRFFQIDRLLINPVMPGFTHQFHAGELMFTLRVYEPIRGLWQ